MNSTMEYFSRILEISLQDLDKYLEFNYTLLINSLLTAIAIICLLPCFYIAFIYVILLFLFIYKLFRQFVLNENESDKDFWTIGMTIATAIWDFHARIYFGYEIIGLENLPQNSPALLVYYHGAIPIDIYYFCCRVFFQRQQMVHTVADRFLYKIPGWPFLGRIFKVTPGSKQDCLDILNNGHCLAVSPGGLYEAQFSDHHYDLFWQNRLGFAKVALETKVPIIPVFTENIREGFRQIGLMRNFAIKLYKATKLPILPIYGGFPVKFRTHLGKPIMYDPKLTAEQLQKKVAKSLQELIKNNQRIPGSIPHALLDRFRTKTKGE